MLKLISLIVFLAAVSLETTVQANKYQNSRPAYGQEVGISIMGAIVSKDPQKSVVLIKEKASGKVKALKVGKSLLDKHPVLHIEKNYIVVKKLSETILVYKDKFAGAAIAKAKSQPSSLGGPKTYKEDGFERKDDGKSEIDIKMTSQYRDNIINNDLQKVLMEATALPYYEGGKIIGFQLSQIEDDSIFSKGGFVNNDVITNVNGVDLNSISGAIKLLKSVKGEKSISVQIKRNGSFRDMTISVD
jgi:type II secretion system protein C